jgi:PAP2 superfamily
MKRIRKSILLLGAVISLYSLSCSRNNFPGNAVDNLPNTVIITWNEVAFEAFGGPAYQHSLMASRINAMTHIAMHDALNAIKPKYSTYVFTGNDIAADPIAAAASAAHTVLLHEIPGKKNFLDSALSQTLSGIAEGDAKTRGISLGKQAAQAIINDRADDGSAGELVVQVPPSTTPGVYQAVPPFNIIFVPHWENVKLFGLERKDQFRSAPHPSLNSDTYTAAFNEVKEKGKLNSTVRTADETAYSKFWYEFSEAGWNRVARTVAINKKLNLFETARLLALVDMALADSYIAGWDAKLHYNFWRPYTAIRKAGSDENSNTIEDPQWEPSENTPPIQDYPSTHSVLGKAGAAVLARLLGDNTAFTMSSFTAVPAGSTRSFSSFSQAANENADSRVKAGIHFRFSCEAGQEMGNKIGDWVVDHYLQPLH